MYCQEASSRAFTLGSPTLYRYKGDPEKQVAGMPRSALPFEKARAAMMEGYSDIASRSEYVFFLEMYS